jgi:hypothetical protein
LEQKQEDRLTYRELIYRIGGKRRFWVACRRDYAYVTQRGRFEGDRQLWVTKLSKPESFGERDNGRALRFHLVTAGDFAAFNSAVKSTLTTVSFAEAGLGDQSVTED